MPTRKPGYDEPAPAAYAGVMVSMPVTMFVFMSVFALVVFLCCAVRMMHAGLPFLYRKCAPDALSCMRQTKAMLTLTQRIVKTAI